MRIASHTERGGPRRFRFAGMQALHHSFDYQVELIAELNDNTRGAMFLIDISSSYELSDHLSLDLLQSPCDDTRR